jgi:hypothetical protein
MIRVHHGLLLACALCIALIGTACGSSEPTTTVAPPTTVADVPTTVVDATTTTLVAAETTTVAEPDTLGSSVFVVPFSMVPGDGSLIRKGLSAGDEYVEFQSGENEWIFISAAGPSSIDGWMNKLAAGGATVGEPFMADIGGIPATVVDSVNEAGAFTLAENLGAGVPPLFSEVGDSIRIYVVDIDGKPVTIGVTTGTDNFESWIAEVEPLLATMQWDLGS